ncbi:co-chaperone YbbN [Inquilinus sp. CAU 1745]|uniref:co-chaperone YbbN n=1 Tax=Inquilinus sp. CAU 1745 TaxID=3140369 RepID=UPI00325C1DA6
MELNLTAAAAPADLVKDTDAASFSADVIEASMTTPIIVDFWAPWCGPCKTLGPLIEKAVRAARGKVKLVKLDIEANPQNQALAAQMRVQSIPAVYAFFQGRPVDGFVGALPESQIKSFIDKLIAMTGDGGADDLAAALDQAKAALEGGDVQTAGAIYQQILEIEPENATALAGLARCMIALGQPDRASEFLDALAPELLAKPEIQSVRTQLDLAAQTAGADARLPELTDRLAREPDDHQARFDLAMAAYGAGRREDAVDALLEIIRRDREWNEGAARVQLLKLFEAFGQTDKLTVQSRRRLSSLLFS